MEKNLKQKIAAKLKTARFLAGYKTARDFAKYAKVKESTYYLHEAGQRTPKLVDLERYCSLLNLDINSLLATYEDTPEDTPSKKQEMLITHPPEPSQETTVISLNTFGIDASLITPNYFLDRQEYNFHLLEKIAESVYAITGELKYNVNPKLILKISISLYSSLITVSDNPAFLSKLIRPLTLAFEAGLSFKDLSLRGSS